MIVDHIVVNSFKGEIHTKTAKSGIHYGPQYYIEVNKDKKPQIFLRANISYNVNIKGISLKPRDEKREKRLKKAYKRFKGDEKIIQHLTLPSVMYEFLNLFKHDYSLKEGDWFYKEEVFPLHQNIIHVTGSSGSGKTTMFNKLKKAGFNVFDTDEVMKDNGWSYSKAEDFINSFGKKKVAFFGCIIPYLTKCAGHRFVIDIPLEENYKRVMSRVLDDVVKNETHLKDLIEKGETKKIPDIAAQKYDVTIPFMLDWREYVFEETKMINDMVDDGYLLFSAETILRKVKKLL